MMLATGIASHPRCLAGHTVVMNCTVTMRWGLEHKFRRWHLRAGVRFRVVHSKTSHMRRVHFPLRFLTPLQRLESKARTDSAWAAHELGLSLSRNVSTKSESPRVVFSGIQPTGIPHVRRFFFSREGHVHAMLTMISAWKLLWGACELGQVTVDCCARGQAYFLRRRLACPHTTPRPRTSL